MKLFIFIVLCFNSYLLFALTPEQIKSDALTQLSMFEKLDVEEQPTELYYQKWLDPDWKNTLKYTYKYNAGILSEYQSYLWESSDETWTPNSRSNYSYNGDGKVSEIISQSWKNNEWVNSNKILFSYDNGKVTLENSFLWDGNSWTDYDKTVKTYDGTSGNIIELIYSIKSEGNWVENSKTTFIYNSLNFLETETSYSKDEISGWLPISKKYYTYNSNNEIDKMVSSTFYGGNWTDEKRITFAYNALNKLATKMFEKNTSGVWIRQNFTIFNYDFKSRLYEKLSQVWLVNNWKNDNRELTFYEGDGVKYSNENCNIVMNNFPNPFANETELNCYMSFSSNVSIDIYDGSAKFVKNLFSGYLNEGNYKYSITNNELNAGVYFCRMQTEKGTKTIKLVVL